MAVKVPIKSSHKNISTAGHSCPPSGQFKVVRPSPPKQGPPIQNKRFK